MSKIKIEDLKTFCSAALEKAGMKPEFAVITADALCDTDHIRRFRKKRTAENRSGGFDRGSRSVGKQR